MASSGLGVAVGVFVDVSAVVMSGVCVDTEAAVPVVGGASVFVGKLVAVDGD